MQIKAWKESILKSYNSTRIKRIIADLYFISNWRLLFYYLRKSIKSVSSACHWRRSRTLKSFNSTQIKRIRQVIADLYFISNWRLLFHYLRKSIKSASPACHWRRSRTLKSFNSTQIKRIIADNKKQNQRKSIDCVPAAQHSRRSEIINSLSP